MSKIVTYDVDVQDLAKYIEGSNSNLSEKRFFQLGALQTIFHLQSLQSLYHTQEKLATCLENNDIDGIKSMKQEYSNIIKACLQDFHTRAKTSSTLSEQFSHFNEEEILQNPEKLKEILSQEASIQQEINSVTNERLIIPAIRLAISQIDAIENLEKSADLDQLKLSVAANNHQYELKADELKRAQKEQTILDIVQRNGFFILKDGKCKYIDFDEEGRQSHIAFQQKKLKDAGLSAGQIDFIFHQCNQSNINGGYNAAIDPMAKPAANLIVEVDTKSKKVLLHSLSYNQRLHVADDNMEMKLAGTSKLSLDISPLSDSDRYLNGANQNIAIKLTSNFLQVTNPTAEQGSLDFTAPPELLKITSNKAFRKDFAKLESACLSSLAHETLIAKIQDHNSYNLDIRARFLQQTVFNPELDKTQRQSIVRSLKNLETTGEVFQLATQSALIEFLEPELQKLKESGQKLDQTKHNELNDKIVDILDPLATNDAEKKQLKDLASGLVLQCASNYGNNLTIRKVIEKWACDFCDLFQFSKPHKIKEISRNNLKKHFNKKHQSFDISF